MQGRSLNLSTFMVMVSLTFWATLRGGIGAFLAIPMMVVTMVVCSEVPATRWIAVLLSTDGQLQDEQEAEASKRKTETANSDQSTQNNDEAFQVELAKHRRDYENRDN